MEGKATIARGRVQSWAIGRSMDDLDGEMEKVDKLRRMMEVGNGEAVKLLKLLSQLYFGVHMNCSPQSSADVSEDNKVAYGNPHYSSKLAVP